VSWRAAEAELKLAEEDRCGAATADQERPESTFYTSRMTREAFPGLSNTAIELVRCWPGQGRVRVFTMVSTVETDLLPRSLERLASRPKNFAAVMFGRTLTQPRLHPRYVMTRDIWARPGETLRMKRASYAAKTVAM
jgi:hypothetical protein